MLDLPSTPLPQARIVLQGKPAMANVAFSTRAIEYPPKIDAAQLHTRHHPGFRLVTASFHRCFGRYRLYPGSESTPFEWLPDVVQPSFQ